MGRYAGKFGKKRRIPLVSWVMILAAVLSLVTLVLCCMPTRELLPAVPTE